ncbi:MAG: TetR/AcrR family transcriptional regulator [Anaerolineae bacterium]
MGTQNTPQPDRAQERRQQILDAALACFARKGYHKTTMDDIVTESGLSKGTLYWYFKSKDELFFSLINSFFLAMQQDLDGIFEQPVSASDKLRTLAHEFARFYEEVAEFLNVFFEFWMQGTLNEQLNQLFHGMLTRYRGMIAGIIEEGVKAGEFKTVDAGQLALSVMAAYDGLWFYKMLMPDLVDLDRASQVFIETLFSGLAANEQRQGQ